MGEPRQPEDAKNAKSGAEPGATPNTDKSRNPDRPVDGEDVFGGHERTQKNEDVQSPAQKP
jgi:hypothetical protein